MRLLIAPLLLIFLLAGTINIQAKATKATANYATSFTETSSTSNSSAIRYAQSATNALKAEKATTAQESNMQVANIQQGKSITVSQASTDELATTMFIKGLFYGIASILILINLLSFLIFDDKLFLLFGTSLLTATAFIVFNDTILQLIGMGNVLNPTLVNSLFLLIATTAFAVFSSKFLTLEQLQPNIKYVAAFLIIVNCMVITFGWFAEIDFLATIANAISILLLSGYFLAGIMQFNKTNYAKIYVIAMVIPLIILADLTVFQPLGLSFLSTTINHLKGAIFIEMLVITYGIIYRKNEVKENNVIKQTQMRIFLKGQEMTSREKTEKHLEDVYLENVIMQYDLDGLEIKLLQYISENKPNEKIARKLKLNLDELDELTDDLYHKLEIKEHINDDYRMVAAQPDYIYN